MIVMAANAYRAMLALSDSSNKERQQSECKGERFIDAYSKFVAYRCPTDDQYLKNLFYLDWRIVFSDRYAFYMPFNTSLDVVNVLISIRDRFGQ